mgnify:FL=1
MRSFDLGMSRPLWFRVRWSRTLGDESVATGTEALLKVIPAMRGFLLGQVRLCA